MTYPNEITRLYGDDVFATILNTPSAFIVIIRDTLGATVERVTFSDIDRAEAYAREALELRKGALRETHTRGDAWIRRLPSFAP
jgi:hypothetical protein